jgi:hypothetical protein
MILVYGTVGFAIALVTLFIPIGILEQFSKVCMLESLLAHLLTLFNSPRRGWILRHAQFPSSRFDRDSR